MKLLFVTKILPRAGFSTGETIIYQRLRGLAARGHQVSLAAFRVEPEQQPDQALREALHTIEVLPPPRERPWPAYLAGMLRTNVPPHFAAVYDPRMRRLVGDLVERERHDIVIAEYSSMGQYLCHNPYLPAVRKVISCHRSATMMCRLAVDVLGSSPASLRQRLQLIGLQRFEFGLYEAVDRILVLTPWERYRLLSYAPDLRISVVPCGIDCCAAAGHPGGPPPPRPTSPPVVLFTGNYFERDNVDAVLWFGRKAWPAVRARHPDAIFRVVGNGVTPAMYRLARPRSGIEFVGRVTDMSACLQAATLFVCPVRLGTGMRGKVLEAMAAGVPVVSTTHGMEGIPAQNGDQCLLADHPRLLAQHVNLLLEDDDLRRRLSRDARAFAAARFSWPRVIEHLESVLLELAANQGQRCLG
ncbi:MAG: glycosyltransferase family 4 protein [Candidatus Marinimicrobia bacterium]|nr:glycosyltransferase family 4 protein [Candidatus Neomarinimicrobiota bacterium]